MNDKEIIEVNGSKIFFENGKMKTLFSIKIQSTGYMEIEELRSLLHASIKLHRRQLTSKGISNNGLYNIENGKGKNKPD